MKNKTAFGKDILYAEFVTLGKEIAQKQNKKLLAHYIHLLQGSNKILSQQAATVLHHASDVNVSLFEPFLPKLIQVLENPIHDSGPRMIFRIFRKIEIPQGNLGNVIDLCFKYLNDPKTPVAIKVNAMYTIARYFDQYPDLKHEFKAATETNPSKDLPSFKSCLNQIAKNRIT